MNLRRYSFAFFLPFAIACSKPTLVTEVVRPVRTVKVTPQENNESLTQTGEVQARRETDLSFQIGGRVAHRLVELGTTVKRGQLLVTLDTCIVTNELRVAEADLASATSAFELASASHARVKQLFSGESASRQQLDESTANLRAAAARRDAAGVATEIGRKKLSYTRLLAEESGVVVGVGANQGQIVGPGQMIVRVATHERDAVFSVSQQWVKTIKPEIQVHVTLASNPSMTAQGTLHEISPTADPVTRTYSVRIALQNPAKDFFIGSTVIGRINLPTHTQVVLPAAALTSEDDSPAVYLVETPAKTLRRRKVSVARMENDCLYIASGLFAGDVVVTAGVTKLRPGQVVALAPMEGKGP